jgi:hypothetical protein
MGPATLERYFPILITLSFLWVAGWILASILYRRSHGKPIVSQGVANATYLETAASGHSNRAWYTRAGGASRCLIVAVVGERLLIRPRFPFNLMFLPEIYGLEHDVSLHDIIDARPRESFMRQKIDLEFRDPTGTTESVTLFLHDTQAFLAALRRPMQPHSDADAAQ